jgi:hypothetical protein
MARKAKRNSKTLPNKGKVTVTMKFSYHMDGENDDTAGFVDAIAYVQLLRDEIKEHYPESISVSIPGGHRLKVPPRF